MTGIRDVREGVDDFRGKACSKCKRVRPGREFAPAPHHSDRLSSWCRPCIRERSRAAYAAAPKRTQARSPEQQARRSALQRQRLYGARPEVVEAMRQAQGGVCAICKTDQPGGRGDFHVDHDHETGRIRGLLCSPCNTRLGVVEGWFSVYRDSLNRYLMVTA